MVLQAVTFSGSGSEGYGAVVGSISGAFICISGVTFLTGSFFGGIVGGVVGFFGGAFIGDKIDGFIHRRIKIETAKDIENQMNEIKNNYKGFSLIESNKQFTIQVR